MIVAAGLLLLADVSSGRAQTAVAVTTLKFDDLGLSPGGTHMPAQHHGFVWGTSDWHFLSGPGTSTNTYLALSGTATSIVSRNGTAFYFDGLTAWSRRGADANGLFYYILSLRGTNVYDGRDDGNEGKNKFTAAHVNFPPHYTGLVDRVAIVFTQGGDDWDHLAVDDFQFHGRQGVPGPADITITKQAGAFDLLFSGLPGEPYRIDAQDDLGTDTWQQQGVATADAGGVVHFTDADTGHTRRFYRAARP